MSAARALHTCEAETVESWDKPYVVCGAPARWMYGQQNSKRYLLCDEHAETFSEFVQPIAEVAP